jgi:hypothetical protein
MRRSLLVFLTVIVLSACATLVTGRPEYQQLLVTERYDAAYIRARAVAVGLGLHIVRTQDTARIFTAKRPASGEEVTVTIAPSGMGCLITFQGTPLHDVTHIPHPFSWVEDGFSKSALPPAEGRLPSIHQRNGGRTRAAALWV